VHIYHTHVYTDTWYIYIQTHLHTHLYLYKYMLLLFVAWLVLPSWVVLFRKRAIHHTQKSPTSLTKKAHTSQKSIYTSHKWSPRQHVYCLTHIARAKLQLGARCGCSCCRVLQRAVVCCSELYRCSANSRECSCCGVSTFQSSLVTQPHISLKRAVYLPQQRPTIAFFRVTVCQLGPCIYMYIYIYI